LTNKVFIAWRIWMNVCPESTVKLIMQVNRLPFLKDLLPLPTAWVSRHSHSFSRRSSKPQNSIWHGVWDCECKRESIKTASSAIISLLTMRVNAFSSIDKPFNVVQLLKG